MIKKRVDVLNKLIRRYKYLQQTLEDALKRHLVYIHKLSEEDLNKFGTAVGLLIGLQLMTFGTLSVLQAEHLVKEGLSLKFLTIVIRTFLRESSIEQLGSSLQKSNMDEGLLNFFPINKRSAEYFGRHFAAEGLDDVVEYHRRKMLNKSKQQLSNLLHEQFSSASNAAEIITFLKQEFKTSVMTEEERIVLVWDSLIKSADLSTRADQASQQVLKTVQNWSKVLAEFCPTTKGEASLLSRIQSSCYEDARLTNCFRNIVMLLYNREVLSEDTILGWNERSANLKGRPVFKKQLEPFIEWLRTAEEEEDDGSDASGTKEATSKPFVSTSS